MSRIKSRLTVFFEEPFWVGVFEQETDGVICAARVVFGAQPTDAEVFEFVLRHGGGGTEWQNGRVPEENAPHQLSSESSSCLTSRELISFSILAP